MIFNKSISNLSDVELIQRYKRSGNNRWVGELFNRHAHLVFGVCMKYFKDPHKAEDATMRVFEKLLKDLRKAEVSQFKGWLYMVSKNACLMELRKPSKEVHNEVTLQQLESEDSIEEKMKLETTLVQLETAIEALKEDQRICVKLFFIEKKSYREIVEQTGMNLKKVKSNIQNGKRNLKITLANVS